MQLYHWRKNLKKCNSMLILNRRKMSPIWKRTFDSQIYQLRWLPLQVCASLLSLAITFETLWKTLESVQFDKLFPFRNRLHSLKHRGQVGMLNLFFWYFNGRCSGGRISVCAFSRSVSILKPTRVFWSDFPQQNELIANSTRVCTYRQKRSVCAFSRCTMSFLNQHGFVGFLNNILHRNKNCMSR